jgi:hypothetical protein
MKNKMNNKNAFESRMRVHQKYVYSIQYWPLLLSDE